MRWTTSRLPLTSSPESATTASPPRLELIELVGRPRVLVAAFAAQHLPAQPRRLDRTRPSHIRDHLRQLVGVHRPRTRTSHRPRFLQRLHELPVLAARLTATPADPALDRRLTDPDRTAGIGQRHPRRRALGQRPLGLWGELGRAQAPSPCCRVLQEASECYVRDYGSDPRRMAPTPVAASR